VSPVCKGYDGRGYAVGDRVELCPSLDLWMRGARFGEVVQLRATTADRVVVKLDLTGSKIGGSEETFRRV
jgi:hypothetical protein